MFLVVVGAGVVVGVGVVVGTAVVVGAAVIVGASPDGRSGFGMFLGIIF